MSQVIIQENESISEEVYEARKRIVLELIGKFNVERYIYIAISVLSFFLTLYLAFDMVVKKTADFERLVTLFGPTGFLAYAVSRIMYMWSKSLKIIFTGKF